ncbi:RNA polymerase sigma factor [Ruania halotolerans]|uniref:RNA polymerase sigma factor n=1 Tax=Ruania halotolerans TaxID=2897773 RepID=UPI001E436729|nr:sigma-70 family RNA polymerase sigma factor [Ruania halotolerans]UFU06965.1 sigma-70 family RNA polymerase sigma factor [Ruania halotolerans]
MTRTNDRLGELLRRNARDLLAYLERRIGPDDATDALSEVMTTAWRRAAAVPDDGLQARLWLFGVARNVVANARRGQRRRSLLVLRAQNAEPAGGATAPHADDGLDVRDAVARLDDDLAEVVRLVHWEGFTLAEVAQVLDTPATTVRSKYARAKQQLRAALCSSEVLEADV